MKQIVVFDTGTGGRIFTEYLRREMRGVEVIEVIDETHAPYGERSGGEIARLTEEALEGHLGTGAVVVLACNTATAYAIDGLRAKYPAQAFVGVEPAVGPAVKLMKNGKIVVLATPATLRSRHYLELKKKYAGEVAIFEPDCASWARKIDAGELDEQEIRDTLSPLAGEAPDVVVLACTHYLAIPREVLADIFPKAVIYAPLDAVARRVKALLRQR